jgi:hypothetical protein
MSQYPSYRKDIFARNGPGNFATGLNHKRHITVESDQIRTATAAWKATTPASISIEHSSRERTKRKRDLETFYSPWGQVELT